MEDDAPAGELAAELAELYRAPHEALVATEARLARARTAADDLAAQLAALER